MISPTGPWVRDPQDVPDELPLYGPGWDDLVADAKRRATAEWVRLGDEGIREARERNRRAARRFLAGHWTRSLRGPVSEPHEGWDSGIRMAVAEAMAERLAGRGVDPDLAAVLLAGWGATYADPPLVEADAVAAVHRAFPGARRAA